VQCDLHSACAWKNVSHASFERNLFSGQALVNVLVSLELGIATVDSSVAGLGGCPYAKGATGNVATEDVIYLLNGLGVETGIDIDKLAEAGEFISGVLSKRSSSKAGTAITAKRRDRA
jgi:hydroxymethylglutaryl-CoA lyase